VTGEVAEWSKAAVSKTVVPCGTQGSNPCLSAVIPCGVMRYKKEKLSERKMLSATLTGAISYMLSIGRIPLLLIHSELSERVDVVHHLQFVICIMPPLSSYLDCP
jgi:hypothetical protein